MASKPTQEQYEEFVIACRFGDLEDVEAFTKEFGFDAINDARDDRGNTALHMICANGHLGALAVLARTQMLRRCPRRAETPRVAHHRCSETPHSAPVEVDARGEERKWLAGDTLGSVQQSAAMCQGAGRGGAGEARRRDQHIEGMSAVRMVDRAHVSKQIEPAEKRSRRLCSPARARKSSRAGSRDTSGRLKAERRRRSELLLEQRSRVGMMTR